MKSKILCLSVVALAAALLCGCVFVPKTKIKGSIGGLPFNIESPKDSTLKKLEITVATNGTCTVKIDELTAHMNPDVIGQTAAGQAAVTKEIMTGSSAMASDVTRAAIEAAKK